MYPTPRVVWKMSDIPTKLIGFFTILAVLCAPGGATSILAAQAKAEAPRAAAMVLSDRERGAFALALKAVSRRSWSRAQNYAEQSGSSLVKKIIEWTYMRERDAHVTFAEFVAFLADSPEWPDLGLIRRRAEEVLDENGSGLSPVQVVAWFRKYPPLTDKGRVGFARALQATGATNEAETIARKAWRAGSFSRDAEAAFQRSFRGVLSAEDHRRRLDNLLYEKHTVQATRMLSRVDKASAAVGRARIGLITSRGSVDRLVAAVPASHVNDLGLIYDRIVWRRRHGRANAAPELLPLHADRGHRPEMLWKLREIISKEMFNDGKAKQAYAVVKNRGELTSAADISDAEWLEGWIALRFLNDPEAALPHFEKVYDLVKLPPNAARGAYWTGRAISALGREDIAAEWYRRAAAYITTFYGQLALSRLHEDHLPTLPIDPIPTEDDYAKFYSREVTHAMQALAEIRDTDYLRSFVLAAADSSHSAVDTFIAAEFALTAGHPEWGVALSRQAARDNITVLAHGYPIPAYDYPPSIDRAFLLGLIRQESSFDVGAKSSAGARGLMQLMPATARNMARAERIRYRRAKLTSDAGYNMRLSTAYLRRLLDRFDDSYVLALAAYNAGPTRARQWMRKFGDPRTMGSDAVDWTERIPFYETRIYVQNVMSNLMVYRARMANTQTIAQSLESELSRP